VFTAPVAHVQLVVLERTESRSFPFSLSRK
jgi:hypothetical protein